MKVEKGIPIPSRGNTKYPFSQMDKHDSFTVPLDKHKAVCQSIRWQHIKTDRVYTTRKMGDVVRVWRIA